MGARKIVIGLLVLVSWAVGVATAIDCPTVTGFLTACSNFIVYGSPDPLPGSPCCDAMTSLSVIAESVDNRVSVCRCLLGILNTYSFHATAIATLPGFCGVNMGFVIDPNADCSYVP